MSTPELWFLIEGINPEPWEPPESAIGRRAGKPYIQHYSPEKYKNFTEAVRSAFSQEYPDFVPIDGEVLDVRFFLWREQSVFETPTGRKSQANIADATNMQKAIEDALQGLLYVNDRDNHRVSCEIMSQDKETEPAILVQIQAYSGPNERAQSKRIALKAAIPPPPDNALPPERTADDLF